jgi:hypothetical protein
MGTLHVIVCFQDQELSDGKNPDNRPNKYNYRGQKKVVSLLTINDVPTTLETITVNMLLSSRLFSRITQKKPELEPAIEILVNAIKEKEPYDDTINYDGENGTIRFTVIKYV